MDDEKKPPAEVMIQARNVWKSYGKLQVLKKTLASPLLWST